MRNLEDEAIRITVYPPLLQGKTADSKRDHTLSCSNAFHFKSDGYRIVPVCAIQVHIYVTIVRLFIYEA